MLVDHLHIDRLHNPHRRRSLSVLALDDLAIHALQMPSHEVPSHGECKPLTLEDDGCRETSELAEVGGREKSVGEVFRDKEAGDGCRGDGVGEGERAEGL